MVQDCCGNWGHFERKLNYQKYNVLQDFLFTYFFTYFIYIILSCISLQVLHSQSVNDTATKPWIIVETSGAIITASCDCKASLGGTCTHASAVLFWVEAAVKLREQRTVTEEKAYWLLPSGFKKLQYLPVCEIDFTSAKTKKEKTR